MIEIKVPQQQIERLQQALKDAKRTVAQELAVAINATGKFLSREISKVVREELVASKKSVDKALQIHGRARPGALAVTVQMKKTERLSLREFQARETAKGVSYRISKSSGRKLAVSAFAVRRFGGRVFKRIEKTRIPITQLHGPSPWGVFVSGGRESRVINAGEAELLKQVERRIRFVNLKKQGTIRA